MVLLNILEDITIGDGAAILAFIVSMVSGIAYLRKHLKDWVSGAVREDIKAVSDKVDVVQDELVQLKNDRLKDNADAARYRILVFNDELLRKVAHSKEHFDQTLEDIDNYERYCAKNPMYKNSKATLAIAEIKRCYSKCEAEGTFL